MCANVGAVPRPGESVSGCSRQTYSHLLGDSTYRRNTAVWSKVAGSSESSSVSIDDGTTAAKYCTLAEYSLSEGENEWTLLAAVSNDNGATSGGVTIGTSQTSSVAGARKFLVAVISVRRGSSSVAITTSWANINLSHALTGGAASGGMSVGQGYGNSDSDGVKESFGTISNAVSNTGLIAGLLVFRTASGSSPAPPRRVMQVE